ncbi:protein of unknown function [Rathayibacter oskolensis]|uniref:DUF4192 domain-containing protein n=1 Tax=Rathayibacter oskolensis TaxID=1891671 RepID=A0A1X7NB53_9MICO|nr:DUF4192 family protein [Rathayibacter oskolensis]SMH34840.1 protein of unknown function [Rathayibacter oskolensis]
MTLTALETSPSSDHVLRSVPLLVGHEPRESLVLVPMRGGRATGALRFDLPDHDPEPCVRAYIGALGRFGRAEAALAVIYSDRSPRSWSSELEGALLARARRVGLRGFDVVVVGPAERMVDRALGARRSSDPGPTGSARSERTGGLLPVVRRETALAIAAQVDVLLDRHPRADLGAQVRSSVDALLRRAASGRGGQHRPGQLAALIVCAQRPEWIEHARRLVATTAPSPSDDLLELIAVAAASSPATERVPVLVLLAGLRWSAGLREDAVQLAAWATRSDPHDLGARMLEAALHGTAERSEPTRADRAA